jgi:CCR4-NOT transcription complex subunit 7/8
MITSGVILNPNNHWITFHGGIDFGYILRAFVGCDLPTDEDSFFDMMNIYFYNYYDIKVIKKDIEYLSGGLSKIAKELDVERIGTLH